ncbi:MAG: DNA polymerase III subunit delta [bacterium]
MKDVYAKDFWASFKKGELFPVYLLHGDDTRSLDRAKKALEDKVISPELSEFNSDYFYGKESDISEVLNSVQTLPMMADKRFVLIKRAEEISGPARDRLIEYIKSPASSTVLVLVSQGLALKGQGARQGDINLVKAVSSSGMCVNFTTPKPDKLPAYVEGMARERGKRLERPAVSALLDLTGADLKGIEQELAKVCLFVGDRELITADDVSEAVADIKEGEIFEFTDAMGDRDIEKSLRIYRLMRQENKEPIMILSMILRHFRLIWQIQDYRERGEPDAQIAKKLRLHPYIFKTTYKPRADKFPESDTGRITTVLADLDLSLKSKNVDRDVLFEHTVIELCLGRPA